MIEVHTLSLSLSLSLYLSLSHSLTPTHPPSPSPTVYHVGPNGWTQVWAGDTTDMFYKYYPLKNTKTIEVEKEEVPGPIGSRHGA